MTPSSADDRQLEAAVAAASAARGSPKATTRGHQPGDEERHAEQEVQRDRGADELGQVGRHRDQLGLDPEPAGDRARRSARGTAPEGCGPWRCRSSPTGSGSASPSGSPRGSPTAAGSRTSRRRRCWWRSCRGRRRRCRDERGAEQRQHAAQAAPRADALRARLGGGQATAPPASTAGGGGGGRQPPPPRAWRGRARRRGRGPSLAEARRTAGRRTAASRRPRSVTRARSRARPGSAASPGRSRRRARSVPRAPAVERLRGSGRASSISSVARRDRVAVRVGVGLPSFAAISSSSSSERTCSSTSASSWTRSHGTPSDSARYGSSRRWWRITSSATRRPAAVSSTPW